MTFRFYIFSLIFQSFVVSALILYPREAPAPIQSTLASMEVLEYRKFPAPDDWEKTLRLMNQLDDLQNRLDHLETHRIVNRKYRDPFAFEQAPASLSVDENPILKVEPKKTPKPVLIPKPVPVEEMAVAAPVQPRPTIRIKAQTEKKKPTSGS